jgi:hypothetical protein
MTKVHPITLKGKPGNWVALAGLSHRIVAEARTLQAAARIARKKRIKDPTFARIPRAECTLVL